MPQQPADPLLPLQWYLDADGHAFATVDINVRDAWTDYSGRGVRVAILDSPIDPSHPDLDARLQIIPYPGEPAPTYFGDAHGMATAGIIGAEANGEGVVGVAFEATLASLNSGGNTDINRYANTFPLLPGFDIAIGGYTGPSAFDPYMSLSLWTQLSSALETSASTGRSGLGTVFVLGAGNSGGDDTNSGMLRLQGERHMIAVGATNHNGFVTSYSSEGANVFITAPSGDGGFETGIVTTDARGDAGYNTGAQAVPADYTNGFGGTSASSPMVVGVVALMMEANESLGWRDVRDILAISARHTGSNINGPRSSTSEAIYEQYTWRLNAAANVNGGGYHFSNDYGFGLVDATAAVRLAESWTGSQTSANELSLTAGFTGAAPIPTRGANRQLTTSLEIGTGVIVETVTLALDISHGNANNLIIRLYSPSGTESTLFYLDSERPSSFGLTKAFRPWTFTSQAFRGEDAAGIWRVTIEQLRETEAAPGSLKSAQLTIYGDAASADSTWFYTNEYGELAGIAQNSTLSDASGNDLINAAAVSGDIVLDLRPGRGGSINGHGLTIAAGTTIEHATSGDGDDRISGNTLANHLKGGRGKDTLEGREGNDTLEGGRDADTLIGGSGDDLLIGDAGNDALRGDAGNDVLRGGDGRDMASYRDAPSGVTIDLTRTDVQNTGGAGNDLLDSIENLTGSAHADRLTGDGGDNTLWGLAGADVILGAAGNDMITGGPGADSLDGGTGNDTVSYAGSVGSVTVSLTLSDPLTGQQIARGGDAQGDQIFNFENIIGGNGNDRLIGNGGDNRIAGGAGTDVLSGAAGNDVFVFGATDHVGATGMDRITDFRALALPIAARDRIDLRAVDAISGGVDDAFIFIGTAAFTAAGQLRAFFDGIDTILQGNTTLAAPETPELPELQIALTGDLTGVLAGVDFYL